ncbi:MAG TPA: transketolase C-terminal domain-containing protein, partial [Pyrinomonadaceae bacterium]
GLLRGAYVIADATKTGFEPIAADASPNVVENEPATPALIIIATGSEVSLALEARDVLQQEGTPTRVVSMPCWELFEEQPKEYRDEVLPPSVAARLSIEAGARLGWDRYVGSQGDCISIDRFGASAPGDVALKELGFNVENVLQHARALLGK